MASDVLPTLTIGRTNGSATFIFKDDAPLQYASLFVQGDEAILYGSTIDLQVTTKFLYIRCSSLRLQDGFHLTVLQDGFISATRIEFLAAAHFTIALYARTKITSNAQVDSDRPRNVGFINKGSLFVDRTLSLMCGFMNLGTTLLHENAQLLLGGGGTNHGNLTICASCSVHIEVDPSTALFTIEAGGFVAGKGKLFVVQGILLVNGGYVDAYDVYVGKYAAGATVKGPSENLRAVLQGYGQLGRNVHVEEGGELVVDLKEAARSPIVGDCVIGSLGSMAVYNVGHPMSQPLEVFGAATFKGNVSTFALEGVDLGFKPIEFPLVNFRTMEAPFSSTLADPYCYVSRCGEKYLRVAKTELLLVMVPTVSYSGLVVAVVESDAIKDQTSWVSILADGIAIDHDQVDITDLEREGGETRVALRFVAYEHANALRSATNFLVKVRTDQLYATRLGILQAALSEDQSSPSPFSDDGSDVFLVVLIWLAILLLVIVLCIIFGWWYALQKQRRRRQRSKHRDLARHHAVPTKELSYETPRPSAQATVGQKICYDARHEGVRQLDARQQSMRQLDVKEQSMRQLDAGQQGVRQGNSSSPISTLATTAYSRFSPGPLGFHYTPSPHSRMRSGSEVQESPVTQLHRRMWRPPPLANGSLMMNATPPQSSRRSSPSPTGSPTIANYTPPSGNTRLHEMSPSTTRVMSHSHRLNTSPTTHPTGAQFGDGTDGIFVDLNMRPPSPLPVSVLDEMTSGRNSARTRRTHTTSRVQRSRNVGILGTRTSASERATSDAENPSSPSTASPTYPALQPPADDRSVASSNSAQSHRSASVTILRERVYLHPALTDPSPLDTERHPEGMTTLPVTVPSHALARSAFETSSSVTPLPPPVFPGPSESTKQLLESNAEFLRMLDARKAQGLPDSSHPGTMREGVELLSKSMSPDMSDFGDPANPRPRGGQAYYPDHARQGSRGLNSGDPALSRVAPGHGPEASLRYVGELATSPPRHRTAGVPPANASLGIADDAVELSPWGSPIPRSNPLAAPTQCYPDPGAGAAAPRGMQPAPQALMGAVPYQDAPGESMQYHWSETIEEHETVTFQDVPHGGYPFGDMQSPIRRDPHGRPALAPNDVGAVVYSMPPVDPSFDPSTPEYPRSVHEHPQPSPHPAPEETVMLSPEGQRRLQRLDSPSPGSKRRRSSRAPKPQPGPSAGGTHGVKKKSKGKEKAGSKKGR